MLRFVILFVASAFAVKQNFRVNNGAGVTLAQALATCFTNSSNSLCTYSGGCCSGHGVCTVNTGGGGFVATCTCDALPSECHGASNYDSSTKCATLPSGAVCCDGNDVDFLVSGNCHSSATDPERGAKGTLLRRAGNEQRYTDNYAAVRSEDIDGMANDLMGSSYLDNSVKTTGSMLGLGFLEFAIKDIVHYDYFPISESNRTFDGVTYPAPRWQENTGISGSGYSIPKAFVNVHTGVIDLEPLYEYAPRINGGVYVNVSAAINYWNNTHHMPREFITALRYYARYHYYMARSIEEFLFGGQNSTYATVTRTSALGSWSAAKDTIFEQARRSTIRAGQAFLEYGMLQLFLENAHDNEGYHHTYFEQWFRRDQWQSIYEGGSQWNVAPRPSVRQHHEFAGDLARTYLSHLSLSGLDQLLSMRNDNYNTTHANLLLSANCDGIVPADPDLTYEVLSLQHTQLSRFGSKIRSTYSHELKRNLWIAAELGLPSYAYHVSKLTNANNTGLPPSVSDLNSTAQEYNVYYGALKEKNTLRQYRDRTSSVTFASLAGPINDAIFGDRTSFWARDDLGVPTAHLYHSKIFTTPDDGTSFYTYCYKEGGVCTQASTDAAVVVYATHPHIGDTWPGLEGAEENLYQWRSRGGLFSSPSWQHYEPQDFYMGNPDAEPRRSTLNGVVTEFINPLYYHYDGLQTLAVKESGSDIRYLHNQIVDAFALNMGWTGVYDGYCYTTDWINSGSCSREATNFWTWACIWNYPYI